MSFMLACVPTAQQRPRHMRTKVGHDLTYKSRRQKGNEAELDGLLLPWRPETPFACAVALCFTAVMPIPKSASRKKREAMTRGEILPAVKPDLDNLAKQLKDAMTRTGFWLDDRQVVRLECAKIYGEEPRWEVTLLPLEHVA